MTQSGVVAVRNLKTEKVWLFYAHDIQTENAAQRFKLDLGNHPCAELQKDYTETGLEVFRFETVELTSDPERLEALKKNFSLLYN